MKCLLLGCSLAVMGGSYLVLECEECECSYCILQSISQEDEGSIVIQECVRAGVVCSSVAGRNKVLFSEVKCSLVWLPASKGSIFCCCCCCLVKSIICA